MSRTSVDYESIMQISYYWISEKEQQRFIDDWNNTVKALEEIKLDMSKEMYQGIAYSITQAQTISKYNRLANHLSKLKASLRRKMMTK